MSIDPPKASDGEDRPLVSVIVANYCGAEFLVPALQSASQQSLRDIEIIVSDDYSPDDSVQIVKGLMASDPRIRLITAASNQGPAAARNRALASARGEWIAIFDSDDLMDAGRLENLLRLATDTSADIVADDLAFFRTGEQPHRSLLAGSGIVNPTEISAAMFIAEKAPSGAQIPFGYLKPLIRRDLLEGRRYDESLTIGEDYDLLLRLLLSGAKLVVSPVASYHYRRHSGSVSHRLSSKALKAMLAGHDRLVQDATSLPCVLCGGIFGPPPRSRGQAGLRAFPRRHSQTSPRRVCGTWHASSQSLAQFAAIGGRTVTEELWTTVGQVCTMSAAGSARQPIAIDGIVAINVPAVLAFFMLASLQWGVYLGSLVILVFLAAGGLLMASNVAASIGSMVRYGYLMLLPAFCLLSTLWSNEPAESLRGAVQLAVTFAFRHCDRNAPATRNAAQGSVRCALDNHPGVHLVRPGAR